MSPQQEYLLTILQAATSAEVGLVLRAQAPEQARQALYQARAASKDGSLANLQIRLCQTSDGGNLLLLRQAQTRKPRAGPALEDLLE